VGALRCSVLWKFARARVRAGYAARRNNISDARNRRNRIGVAQPFDIERFSFAHAAYFPHSANLVVGQPGPRKKASLKFGSMETSALLLCQKLSRCNRAHFSVSV
jgi:CO/xanthine dehydrogenase Mo-binding subunit